MKKLVFACLCLLLFSLLTLPIARADSLSDKQRQIEELEKKVTELQSKAKTLAGQIAYYDNQIVLATLKISQSEELIDSIGSKINILEDRLQKRTVILERQIVQTYKQGGANHFQLFLSTINFSQTLSS